MSLQQKTATPALAMYEEFGRAYAAAIENNAWNAGYERPSTLALLPEVKGLSVLDAGCGPGIYAEWLIRRGAHVTAVDVSPTMLALARERLAGQAELRLCDLSDSPLPFAESAFDLVLSSLTIHYVADLNILFQEFFRILRPGGHLVFSTHHPFNDYNDHPNGCYHAVELVEEVWNTIGRPVKVKFYRRPLSGLFEPLLAAGFRIDAVSEGQPNNACRQNFPEAHQRLMTTPGFLFVRARK